MVSASYEITIELLARLGLIVIRCAMIDEFLAEMLAHFIKAQPAPMYVITANVSASTISDWLRTLIPLHLKTAELQTEFLTFLTAIDEIRAERNTLVHGLWRSGPEPNTALIRTIRLSRAEIIVEELRTVADLDHLIELCTEALTKTFLFRDKIGMTATRT